MAGVLGSEPQSEPNAGCKNSNTLLCVGLENKIWARMKCILYRVMDMGGGEGQDSLTLRGYTYSVKQARYTKGVSENVRNVAVYEIELEQTNYGKTGVWKRKTWTSSAYSKAFPGGTQLLRYSYIFPLKVKTLRKTQQAERRAGRQEPNLCPRSDLDVVPPQHSSTRDTYVPLRDKGGNYKERSSFKCVWKAGRGECGRVDGWLWSWCWRNGGLRG